MKQLPVTRRLLLDAVPPEHRAWVDKALITPLNAFLQPVAELLDAGLALSNLNAQVLSRVVTVPSGATNPAACWPVDFESKLDGACVAVLLARVQELDSGKKPTGAALTGTLAAPSWKEIPSPNKVGRSIRIQNQLGLSASTSYQLTWIALGE